VTGTSDYVALDAGFSHICGRNAAGAAYCWGYGVFGQLGVGGNPPVPDAYAPAAVMGGHAFTSMAAGIGHTCGTTPGSTYCWGGNAQHQLGISMGSSSTPAPVQRGGS
jgi:alpha-tubulin suppressor-like RCC1 family protein